MIKRMDSHPTSVVTDICSGEWRPLGPRYFPHSPLKYFRLAAGTSQGAVQRTTSRACPNHRVHVLVHPRRAAPLLISSRRAQLGP